MPQSQVKSPVTQFELSNQILDSNLFEKIKLTASARLVLIVLCRYYPRIFPCQNTIAQKSGLSVRSVINGISELKSKGLILVECNHNNIYKFTSAFFGLAEIADSTSKTCTQDSEKSAHYKTNKQINKKAFNNNFPTYRTPVNEIKYKSALPVIQQIEKDKETACTPLDFDKAKAIEYYNKLPEFAKNGFYAKKLKEKWNL